MQDITIKFMYYFLLPEFIGIVLVTFADIEFVIFVDILPITVMI